MKISIKKEILWLCIIFSVIFGIFFYLLYKADQKDKKIPNLIYSGKVKNVKYLPEPSLGSRTSVIIFDTGKKFTVSGYVDFSNDCADILKYGKIKFHDCKK